MSARKIGVRLRARSRGFTLIEVLIALMVFSVLAFTVTTRISEIANQTFQLERRSLAQWVADNQVQRLILERRTEALAPNPSPLPNGNRTERVVLAQRDWQVQTAFERAGSDTLRRAEVAVYELDETGKAVGPIYTLTAFLGQY
ncbi:MAG: type II secretion system minor pseudopilin GspI [Pseudomonadota bacterium]